MHLRYVFFATEITNKKSFENSIERKNPLHTQLLPRDLSPPPLPPRLSVKHEFSEEYNNGELKENGLQEVAHSALIKRRSSAMERSKDGISMSPNPQTTDALNNSYFPPAPPVARRTRYEFMI